jgi:hypothetical protein
MIPNVLRYGIIGTDTGTGDESIGDSIDRNLYIRPVVEISNGATITTSINYEILPHEQVIQPLIDAIYAAGAGIRFGNSGENGTNLEFSDCRSLEGFPNLVYSFYTSEGIDERAVRAVDIVLFPSDYAVLIPAERRCITHIRSLRDSPSTTANIGANLLHTTAVHFDMTSEGRIGFCDPI